MYVRVYVYMYIHRPIAIIKSSNALTTACWFPPSSPTLIFFLYKRTFERRVGTRYARKIQRARNKRREKKIHVVSYARSLEIFSKFVVSFFFNFLKRAIPIININWHNIGNRAREYLRESWFGIFAFLDRATRILCRFSLSRSAPRLAFLYRLSLLASCAPTFRLRVPARRRIAPYTPSVQRYIYKNVQSDYNSARARVSVHVVKSPPPVLSRSPSIPVAPLEGHHFT